MAKSLGWISDKRVLFVIALVIGSIALIIANGAHFGLEFTGGTRIPITLAKQVDTTTMNEIVNTLNLRVTKFGLAQVDVSAVGNQQVYVEMPESTNSTYVSDIQSILKAQGNFEAIIDGQVALTGDQIVPGSITEMGTTTGSNVTWGVGFIINENGAKQFASVAYGKGNYPVDLYLDRVRDSAILMNESYIENASLSTSDVENALNKLAVNSNDVIVYIDANQSMTDQDIVNEIIADNKTAATVSGNETQLVALLKANNITVNAKTESDMQPVVINLGISGGINGINIDQWPAIGLLSGPNLSPDLATGQTVQQFSIQGPSQGKTYQDQVAYSQNQMQNIESILSGGALPVGIELGSTITIPPSLGGEFLQDSAIGMIIAAIVVFLVIAFRYKAIKHLAPMIFIAASQMIILVCFMAAVGTLDLPTIAGLFGSMGTSVDYQIVMTDELIGKEGGGKDEAKRRLDRAGYIVTRDVGILTLVMLPLMFSNIVSIIGFVTATLLGSVLGITITLLTYHSFVDHEYKD